MSDVPVFMFTKDRRKGNSAKSAFMNDTRQDIKATIDFLFKQGMWSAYHKKHWLKALETMNEGMLHLWWDSITTGAMFEMDSPHMEMVEARTEAMEEMAEDKVKSTMGKGMKHVKKDN